MSQQEVESRLLKLPADSDPKIIARYVGSVGHEKRKPDEQSRLRYLGHKIPKLRKISKLGFSFSGLSDLEQFKIWQKIWHESQIFEAKCLCLFWLETLKDQRFYLKVWPELKTWVQSVDNWAHSDSLSNIYARSLELEPKLIGDFKKWNQSKNPWERRQSIVGLIYYSNLRKKTPPLKTVLKLVHTLKDDPHFYVQKGVGWTLREIYNLNSSLQLDYVKRHASTLPSAGWTAISEKWPPKTKSTIMKLRKAKSSPEP